MSRSLPLVFVVLASGLLGFLGGSLAQRGGVDTELDLRLADLESRLADQASSLASLEGAERSAGDLLARPVPAVARSTQGDGEEPDPDEEASADGGDPEAVRALALRVEDLDTRLSGLEGDPTERAYRYLDSDNAELRRQGVFSLERLAKSDPEARRVLRDRLADEDKRVRMAAIDTLADIGDKEAIPLISAALGDEENDVRRQAIESLAQMKATEHGGAVAALGQDEDNRVRRTAMDALGKMGYRDGSQALLAGLRDEDQEVRAQAISSLGEIEARDALPVLQQLYRDGDQHRMRVIRSLKQLGDEAPYQEEMTRLRTSALEGTSAEDRVKSIRTLGYYSREEAKPVFEALVEDADSSVRREAQRWLRGGRWGR